MILGGRLVLVCVVCEGRVFVVVVKEFKDSKDNNDG